MSSLTRAILVIGFVFAIVPAAGAQAQCVPFSGAIYGWYTDSWHAVMPILIGTTSRSATLHAVGTSFVDNGDVWRGTETWTIDLGKGDTITAKTRFFCEHVTDAAGMSGIFHVTEGGQIVGGTGKYAKAYGSVMSAGPFGPSVKLPKNVHPPANAQVFWDNTFQGTVCTH